MRAHQIEWLTPGWEFCSTPANLADSPDTLSAAGPQWIATRVPNTAAGSLRDAGLWSLSSPARRFDALDFWYRCRFPRPVGTHADDAWTLGFDGLATLADVWLNGAPLLASDNMFHEHEVPVPAFAAQNELLIRFRSLDHALKAKRPRPRWRAPMIENQQIRWLRTTLLGRTPGWSPPAAAVGPWRGVWLARRAVGIRDLALRSSLNGSVGVVDISVTLGMDVERAELVLERDGRRHAATLEVEAASRRASARLTIENAAHWWPHTHGAPALYTAYLEVDGARSELPRVGFRSIELHADAGAFEVTVNGVRVFCRGACWTPPDVVSLASSRDELAGVLTQARDAGMNMVRIGGTMVYESDDFYALCDELGILVWQDLMFANMDYPEDAAWLTGVTREIGQQLDRLLPHPCLALVCGNSEVEQQAAMWGATRDRWQPALFHSVVPQLLGKLGARVPYWPSSAHGGSFPHQPDRGSTSYYGVGAYLRPLDDARRSELRFASECLGFANVPEDSALAAMPGGLALRVHHPDWKLRAPRDLGAGWDFDDVRDFYLRALFDVDPLALRYADHDRYLHLSRIVSGEVMAAAFTEWRRARSTCNGALVWLLRDLWAGAGWGVTDAFGNPKAAWYALRRVLQSTFVGITDEGTNGLVLHLANEGAAALTGTLTFTLYRHGESVVAVAKRELVVPARGALELNAGELLDGFHDLSYAYRFGPAAYDVAVATFVGVNAAPVFAAHFPTGRAPREVSDIGLSASAQAGDGGYVLTVKARAFARWVTVQADGFVCEDQYFHLPPGTERVLSLRPAVAGAPRALRGIVSALNSSAAAAIEMRA
jgi:beta-mannosidase